MPRYKNVKVLKHGLVTVTTVQSASYSRNTTRLAASGDADKFESSQSEGVSSVSGTVTIQDPVQADALKEAAPATLTWDAEHESGGTNQRVTITNVKFFSLTDTHAHNAYGGQTLGFSAYAPDGNTDPVTVAVAS